jgi:hypothetical protein
MGMIPNWNSSKGSPFRIGTLQEGASYARGIGMRAMTHVEMA